MEKILFLALSAMLFSSQLFAAEKTADKDYVLSHPEFNKVLLDNDHIRVFEYTLEPGEKEGWHSHPDMLLYVVEGGTLHLEFETSESVKINEITGEAKYFAAGEKHTAQNISETRIRLIITEFK